MTLLLPSSALAAASQPAGRERSDCDVAVNGKPREAAMMPPSPRPPIIKEIKWLALAGKLLQLVSEITGDCLLILVNIVSPNYIGTHTSLGLGMRLYTHRVSLIHAVLTFNHSVPGKHVPMYRVSRGQCSSFYTNVWNLYPG